MKKQNKTYWGIALIALLTQVIFSCTQEDLLPHAMPSQIQVIGRVPGFKEHNVSTRTAKNAVESEINYMALFIFDNRGELISKQQITSSVPLFVIDRNTLKAADNNNSGITTSTIYLIANISPETVDSWGITTLNDLNNATTNVTSIDIPQNGFPMIGKATGINLDPNGAVTNGKIEINLENLYAKIVFEVQVNTTQHTGLYDPNFQLIDWEVHNLPSGLNLVATRDDGQTVYYNQVHNTPFTSHRYTGSNPASGSNTIGFSFYMPEHKVTPGTYDSYPTGISDDNKQRYKPCLVENNPGCTGSPTYVIINGVFTDHQNHTKQLSYKIYLGEDNWQDFSITRNCQYNNFITILGTTNSTDGEEGSISVDHRVNITRGDFIVYMERETMLDSHIEVRPIRMQILKKEGVNKQHINLYLANPSTPNKSIAKDDNTYKWARMEVVKEGMNTESYCDYSEGNTLNKGRRKYFTTNLLTELNEDNINGNGITATLTDEENVVWIYFDENTHASENGVRRIMLVAEYYENDILVSHTEYLFQQHDLFPVIYTDKDAGIEYRYDIEFYEEYLHNFNANDEHTLTRQGMPWGPKENISYEIMAIQDVQSAWADNLQYIENAIKRAGGFYDFQDNYWGRKYTDKLIDKMGQGILTQDAMPNSAAQHCHNKNKRNANGEVENIQWYLPAIGELQHIMSAAYTKFNMFQDNQYWSSQTSYRIGHFNYRLLWGWLGSVEGDYYYEDQEWARATKAVYMGNDVYEYQPSEIEGISKTWTGSVTNQTGSFSNEVAPASRDEGNQLRDKVLRVRAVRNKYQRNVGHSEWTEITTEE